ncbi:MAG: UbiA prenyltransferase family protein [Deltaproteobacteria bacterium]|nr:UbiA prenyltransferase family protein [Deltaproteobacteria bacterium]
MLKNRSHFALARDLIVHLRLHFQLLLAPIFLWGYFLAGGRPDHVFWLAFLAFHIFLYGGITAFNSYYDRDQGPVGGLLKPPPVTQALFPFSLIVQAFGLILAAFVNLHFWIIYLLISLMGLAYSHPRLRWKSRPLVGLCTVALGQGTLASLGGWVCTRPDLAAVDGASWLGMLAVTLATTGFYPLTQIYQMDEDRTRGDWTFAVWAGPRRLFTFAIITQSLAVGLMAVMIGWWFGLIDTLIIASFYGTLLTGTAQWARSFQSTEVLSNYRRIMGIHTLTSLGFMAFIVLHMTGLW